MSNVPTNEEKYNMNKVYKYVYSKYLTASRQAKKQIIYKILLKKYPKAKIDFYWRYL
jgi:hypothetical protein